LAFRDSVFHAIKQTTLLGTYKKPESRIYESICKELHALTDIDAERKFFIVSSDLVENSELLYAYKESFLRIIATDREKAKEVVKEKFEDASELPNDLKGIVIYILYKPDSKSNDILFTFFRELYRTIFEKRGAVVYVKSTNIIKQYCHE
jgi:hypothetical protein